MSEKYYKCLTKYRTGGHSGFAWPEEGVELEPVSGPLKLCENGYHVCGPDHLLEWISSGDVYEFEPGDAEAIHGFNKSCFRSGKLGKKLKWTEREQLLFGADCAERVLHLFEREYPDDKRVKQCIDAVRAKAAGHDIDLIAAWDAAWAASDAWAAERKWQAERLLHYLYGEEGSDE